MKETTPCHNPAHTGRAAPEDFENETDRKNGLCQCWGCVYYRPVVTFDRFEWICNYACATGKLRGMRPVDCYYGVGTPCQMQPGTTSAARYRAAVRQRKATRPAATPKGLARLCGSLLQAEGQLSAMQQNAIRKAEQAVGRGYAPGAQAAKAELVQAVRLNLMNARAWPFALLRRRYLLPLDEAGFRRERAAFCAALAAELELLGEGRPC